MTADQAKKEEKLLYYGMTADQAVKEKRFL